MNETLPQQLDPITTAPSGEVHSSQIQDPHKAEIMAYAGKNEEEELLRARKIALDAASRIGEEKAPDPFNVYREPEEIATEYIGRAQRARAAADNNYEKAAGIYDEVHKV
jgi:hypothetical protein